MKNVLSIILILAVTGVGAVAEAQQPKKVPRIGYLSASDPATESTRSEAIRLALRELGYIEGQNIAFEYRYGEGDSEGVNLAGNQNETFDGAGACQGKARLSLTNQV